MRTYFVEAIIPDSFISEKTAQINLIDLRFTRNLPGKKIFSGKKS